MCLTAIVHIAEHTFSTIQINPAPLIGRYFMQFFHSSINCGKKKYFYNVYRFKRNSYFYSVVLNPQEILIHCDLSLSIATLMQLILELLRGQERVKARKTFSVEMEINQGPHLSTVSRKGSKFSLKFRMCNSKYKMIIKRVQGNRTHISK